MNRIATDSEVQKAVKAIGAKYVLILDRSGFRQINETDANDGYINYQISQWSGFEINDETPGFHPILKGRELRLYRIDF